MNKRQVTGTDADDPTIPLPLKKMFESLSNVKRKKDEKGGSLFLMFTIHRFESGFIIFRRVCRSNTLARGYVVL